MRGLPEQSREEAARGLVRILRLAAIAVAFSLVGVAQLDLVWRRDLPTTIMLVSHLPVLGISLAGARLLKTREPVVVVRAFTAAMFLLIGAAILLLPGSLVGVVAAALPMSLVLAVAVVSGISAFTNRLQNALEQESHRFLAADRVVRSGFDMPVEWLAEADSRGLSQARTLTFPSMVFAGDDNMFLASVKAVSNAYPLRGELTYSEQPFGNVLPGTRGPAPGQVWLDSRLFALLDVAIGDTVAVGDADFIVVAAARTEPDQSASFMGYGPRVLMHYDDIPATGVVQPGSRVEFRQLYAGSDAELDDFVAWLETRLGDNQSLLDVNQGQPGIGSALARAESFLLLAGSLGVVLAGVAIALAARRFSERHNDYEAIMKSLGATSGSVNRLYGSSLLLLGIVATTLGCAAGWGMQFAFFELFAEQMPVQPGPSGGRP